MVSQPDNPQLWQQQRDKWLVSVDRLMSDIVAWAEHQGWEVDREQKMVDERPLGTYAAPVLHIRIPGGRLHVNPIGLHVLGAEGRVDLEAWPTLNRVKLVRRQQQWDVLTDSNVPLRTPWEEGAFVRLAHDLVGTP